MHLYNLTLQKASGICIAVHGNFSGSKQQEIAISRGKILELLKPDLNTGKLHTLLSVEVFGVIRSMTPFRLTGGNKDYLVIGSDSGRIVILEYKQPKNVFEKVHSECFGKTGCRRIVPGQYLAIDPKGRALMIGALEKQKFVYILNRDSQANLTISSPLEAHKSYNLCYHMVGIDVGFENPMFACLELDYEEADNDITGKALKTAQQNLTYYELDLGLNHVVRKYAEPLEEMGNFLIQVPGGNEGPGGVLICCENYVIYKNLGDQPDIKFPIPRRRNDLDDPDRGMLFVCSATHKTKSMFFILAQTEQGDVFKITTVTKKSNLDPSQQVPEDESASIVTEIRLKYLDTLPCPAASLCVLKTGFLFAASEFGNHYLYQIAHLGDDDDEPEFSSFMPLEEGDTFFFAPRGLKNFVLVDEIDSLSPVMNCQIADLTNEDTPQLYTACGRGPRSSLKILRHGLEVSEMAVSELPGNPTAVWTVKKKADDEFDSYIVVSFVNATLVLSIGETVEEVTDSGFLGTTMTLACSQLGTEALIQVYPDGIRHIRSDKRVNEWKTPQRKQITKCALNNRQVVIALTGGEIVYFEMDPSGQLNEYTERKELPSTIICMGLGNVPPGEQRSKFLAVGLADNTVRIISLDPMTCLSPLSMQALPATPESLCISETGNIMADSKQPTITEEGGEAGSNANANKNLNLAGNYFLNIGLQNGVLLRTSLDQVTGDLSDTRTRYLGSKAVKLFRIRIQKTEAVLAISSRSWLSYGYESRFHLTPLSIFDSSNPSSQSASGAAAAGSSALLHASSFSSEQCPEGVVAISSNSLRILALEKLGGVFNQTPLPLKYTPRKFVIHHETGSLIIIETDHNAYTQESQQIRKQQMAEEMVKSAGDEEKEMAAEMAAAFLNENLPETGFGSAKAGPGMWASLIRIIQPSSIVGKIGDNIDSFCSFVSPLPQNEAAISIAMTNFNNRPPYEQYVVIGVVRDLNLQTKQNTGGFLYTYLWKDAKLEFVHKTMVEDIPGALAPFQGRLLIGVGRYLRVYEMGKKKLLRKCENKSIPNTIVKIDALGSRIYACDLQDGVHFVRYKARENLLLIFADITIPFWTSTSLLLDYNTVALADKFGTVTVVRLPPSTNDNIEEDPTANRSLWERGLMNGSSQKAEELCYFYVGETVTSMQKATLIPGGFECIVYTTLSGTVGMLLPFTSHEDYDFFQHLEMHMRSENSSLLGRDHLSFRSYHFPVKNVIDGDLCEQFNSLEYSKQRSISDELDRTPNEVSKKLEDIRTRYAF
ncbi:unnamed protein product [Gordionus sp. m RMFG-2023]|uniref:splicing factor 3B subunit 3-like n=1 Tax=Gordionus sp. m RMFG-2023 TaxID=3053472 RepID=UPI0030E196C4